VTPLWSRIGVLVRYGLAEAWSSRITVGLFTLAMLPVLVDLVAIYLANNSLARMMVTRGNAFPLAIDAKFFLRVLSAQCWLALVLNAWVAPRMVSFDLADNALPILLSHPISRFGYVLGKFLSLFSILSLVTWVPCLLLFVYEAYTSPQAWLGANIQVGLGIF
jgi:ABC-type transport system involved in multi-copper enzyme maturation permease subunit